MLQISDMAKDLHRHCPRKVSFDSLYELPLPITLLSALPRQITFSDVDIDGDDGG